MDILSDVPAERAVLAGVCRHGADAYFDICDVVNSESFVDETNAIIWQCFQKVYKDDDNAKIDIPIILSAAQSLGVGVLLNNTEEIKHLNSILKYPVEMSSVKKLAAKIRKLQIARLGFDQLETAKNKLLEVKGDEKISDILNLIEEPIYNFAALLNDKSQETVKLGHNIKEVIQNLKDNPVTQVGISSGFRRWDASIGGGGRKGTVNLIGARMKVGKTFILQNIAINIAEQNIPVLYLDTEMMIGDNQYRVLGNLSEVAINDIEKGTFSKNKADTVKVDKAGAKLAQLPYYYQNISGVPFEEHLGIMRRWIKKEVGFNSDGSAKECVIMYDYLKLMNSEGMGNDMKEWQLLGFMATGLHNFAVRYQLPIYAAIQLNRDGITKESTDTASGSDRILWLCSNFSILKYKSDEERAEDGPANGNRKLLPLICRHGTGLDFGDYININFNSDIGKMAEINLKSELARQNFQVNISDDDAQLIPT